MNTESSKTPKRPPAIQFRPSGLMRDFIDQRVEADGIDMSPNTVAQRDLFRYYHLQHMCLMSVDLTREEAAYLISLSDGLTVHQHPNNIPMLWANVADNDPPEAFGLELDQNQLSEKLRGLSPCQVFSIVDAIERFVAKGDCDGGQPFYDRLEEVGLLKGPLTPQRLPRGSTAFGSD